MRAACTTIKINTDTIPINFKSDNLCAENDQRIVIVHCCPTCDSWIHTCVVN